jgi:hypothetical protein
MAIVIDAALRKISDLVLYSSTELSSGSYDRHAGHGMVPQGNDGFLSNTNSNSS